MKTATSAFRVLRRGAGIAMVALACAQAFSVAAQDRTEKMRRFEADRQACQLGRTGQAYAACTREAQAVFAEPPGSAAPVSAEELQRNNRARCDAQTGEDRTACEARMRGEGSVSGSVSGGGVLRERTTTEIVPSPPQAPAPAGK